MTIKNEVTILVLFLNFLNDIANDLLCEYQYVKYPLECNK